MEESSKIISYRDLQVWRKAVELADQVYGLARQLPMEERFALASQLRRAVTSVPLNIAEGSRRNTTKEFVHFLGVAQGSLAEVETSLHLISKLYNIESENLANDCDEIGRMIHGLQRSLLAS